MRLTAIFGLLGTIVLLEAVMAVKKHKNRPVDDDPYNCNSKCSGDTDYQPVCAQIGTDKTTLKKFGNICLIIVNNCKHLNHQYQPVHYDNCNHIH